MKKLLLLPFLCLMPAAQAVDYVKCEAIQKAAVRVRGSMDWQPALKAELRRREVAKCGEGSSWRDQHPSFLAYMECRNSVFLWKTDAERAAWIDEYQAPMKARLAKIEADYEAEGCY